MDQMDNQLIALLRADARLSVANLAHKLGVARGTVAHRIRRLEDKQIIVGYTVQLRPESQPSEIRAWMAIQVDGNRTNEVVAGLLGEPNAVALHDTNGRWDLMAELRADSPVDLSTVLERVRLIKGIRHTETNILLKTYR
ncbi:Lrp/AsnC family transcriptional regulator [Paraburkholderia tropica]|uniref:Lrp/AsnC family transcriptional regulator n=1 Tax=Paraburkholderia tropica TaxID=92647 RepID=UPI002AB6F2FB|nr:Lrp/AsnC family transcriptional regulator [Paraburkholderia tropica]